MKWSLVCCTVLFLVLISVFSGLRAATLEGTVTIQASDAGFLPPTTDLSLRVLGTGVTGTISDAVGGDSTYEFSIANVPDGQVVLYLEDSGDFYTQQSRFTPVTVSGDMTGIVLTTPVPHYREINYPAFVGDPQYAWNTQFLDQNRGWIVTRYVNALNSEDIRLQVWRTTNGGTNWTQQKEWIFDRDSWDDPVANYSFPDEGIFHFMSETCGIILLERKCLPCGDCGFAFLYTTDGGVTWSTSSVLSTPGISYSVGFSGPKTIVSLGTSHIIAAGGTGCNVQGYGSGFYSCIWESMDGGATWTLVWSQQDAPWATGVGLSSDGHAIVFMTPYSGNNLYLYRDGDSGTWDATPSTTVDVVTESGIQSVELDVNSGYGPADIPMVGNTAWIAATHQSSTGYNDRILRSDNAGATWNLVSQNVPQYMDFVNNTRAFALFGGHAYISADGGKNWLKQDQGDGLCCGGNAIWATGSRNAVWSEIDQVFFYSDPGVASLEILAGSSLSDSWAARGDRKVPMLSIDVHNRGTYDINLGNITVKASGTGDDKSDIQSVKLWLDVDQDGIADSSDILLGSSRFSTDNGQATLSANGRTVSLYVPLRLLVTADFSLTAGVGGSYTFSAAAATVTGTPVGQSQITATAPAGTAIAGRTLQLGDTLFEDDFESGLGAWTADTGVNPWQPWGIDTQDYVSQSSSVWVWANRDYTNYGTVNNLTLSQPLDLTGFSVCTLVMESNHFFDQKVYGRVQVSTNGGSSWQNIAVFGSDSSSVTTGGSFSGITINLSGYTGQSNVLLRFQADWSSSWYYGYSWRIDDVRVIVPYALRSPIYPVGAMMLLLLDK